MKTIVRTVRRFHKKALNRYIKFLVKFDQERATSALYKRRFNKTPDLKNPKDFNEKVLWLKLHWNESLMIRCGDKYKVRCYVKEKGIPQILNPLYGVYDDAKDIEWDKLPDKFVLKTNNASGTNIICENKQTFDKEKASVLLNEWLKKDFGYQMAETHYSKMDPKILCETFIEIENQDVPTDYKFFCFNGKPEFLSIIKGKSPENLAAKPIKNYYDLDLNFLDIQVDNGGIVEKVAQKPKTFNKMIEYAQILAKGCPFVRVDFYDGEDEPVFGEMTFTPTAGMASNYTEEALVKIGSMIDLQSVK